MTVENKSSNKDVVIGLVPEHFNAPLFMGMQNRWFSKDPSSCPVNIKLVECAGGTGEMRRMLLNGSLDIAIGLTEGLAAGIASGDDMYRIAGTFVPTPLVWAISTGVNSTVNSVDELKGARIAVSRFGSGSHIMFNVLATQKGWEEPFDFDVQNDFKGMRDSVNSNLDKGFMWETFTTKPYYDTGELKRIGELKAPWAAFLIAIRLERFAAEPDLLEHTFEIMKRCCDNFLKSKDTESLNFIANTFQQRVDDVQEWYKTVGWSTEIPTVSKSELEHCIEMLYKAKVINNIVPVDTLIEPKFCKLVS